MKSTQLIVSLFLGATGAFAGKNQTRSPSPSFPTCIDIMLPINTTAKNAVLPTFPDATSTSGVYEFLGSINYSSLAHNTISGVFNLSATYCEPSVKVEGREGTIQMLLHGVAYKKSYWTGIDFPFPTFAHEYSWVSHALSQGYATLAVDNLGNGGSTHPDPVQVVQISLQVEVMREIIRRLRDRSLPSILQPYKNIIFVTHSYGSIIGRSLATVHPTDGADAYVLTGASSNLTGIQDAVQNFQLQPAAIVDPARFSDLLPGYASVSALGLRETVYSSAGDFDPQVLAWDLTRPHFLAVGELALPIAETPSNFTGPVLVLTGRDDQIACGAGDFRLVDDSCGVGPSSNPDMTRLLFPRAVRFDSYTPDRTGHALNTHYSAPESFGVAHQWLESNGF